MFISFSGLFCVNNCSSELLLNTRLNNNEESREHVDLVINHEIIEESKEEQLMGNETLEELKALLLLE